MKKILTTALLLSAGTALSQASTWLTDTNDYSATMTFTFGNGSESTKTMTGSPISVSVSGVTAAFSYASTDTRNYSSSSTASQNTWAPNSNVGSGSSWTVCLTITNSSGTDYSFDALQLGMTGLTSSAASQGTSGGTTSFTGEIVANEGATIYKPIDMAISYYSETYSESAIAPELIAKIAYDMANTSVNPSTGTFSFDTITVASDTSITLVFTATQNSQYTSGTFAGLTTLSLGTTAVPEPSSFGLLAGLGALAMVASRRRRRRR